MENKPQSINEEAGLGPNWKPIDAPPITGRPSPPSVGDITPVIPQYFQGSLDPSIQHDADFVNTALRSSSAPRFALMPPGVQSTALTSAQITSVASSAASAGTGPGQGGTGGSGGGGGGSDSDEITLDVPIEFTPTTQTVTLPGPLVLAWATEPAGYEFSVPNGNVGFDGAAGTSGLGAGPLAITSVTPSTSPEWALYVGFLISQTFSVTTLPGWTVMTGNDVNNAFFYRSIPAGGTVSVSQGFSGVGTFAGAIMNFSGTAPTIIQSANAPDIGTGLITATFGSNTTAGSFIIAVYNCTSPANAPGPGTFTDTQNLSLTQISYQSNNGDATHFGASSQVVLLSTARAAAESVTVAYARANGASLHIYEISGLSAIAAIPRFLPEALLNLSTVTGILPVLNGGTGANLSGTGGSGKFVRQFTLGGPFTVGTIAASDLSNTTIGTGAIVLATSPTLTTPQFTGLFQTYNNINVVGNGIAAEYAQVNLTAQNAAIAATTLYTPPGAGTGFYRISAYLKVTTVDLTSSTLGPLTITYTDGTDSVAQSNVMLMADQTGAAVISNSANTTVSTLSGSMVIWALAAVPIKYAIAYASNVAGTMKYEVHLKLEAL